MQAVDLVIFVKHLIGVGEGQELVIYLGRFFESVPYQIRHVSVVTVQRGGPDGFFNLSLNKFVKSSPDLPRRRPLAPIVVILDPEKSVFANFSSTCSIWFSNS